MSLASRAGVSPMMQRRTLAIMGDGGFWHNGLLTGVQSALFNGDDAVLVIIKNGYTSATGTQEIISTPDDERKAHADGQAREPGPHQPHDRADAARASACSGCAPSTATTSTRCGATLRRGVHHRLRRAQGDHRRGRMPARAPAPHQAVDRRPAAAPASAWCASSTASTRTSARATTRASGCRAARR